MTATYKHPKPRKDINAGARLYKSRTQGFVLLIPGNLQGHSGQISRLAIGPVTLTLHHRDRAITGHVPASWLVDLNADSAVTIEHDVPETTPDLW